MKKFLIFILSISLVSTGGYNVYAKSVSELNKEKKEIQNQLTDVKESLIETKDQKSTTMRQVESLDAELDKVQTELTNLEKNLRETEESLVKIEKELDIAKEKKEKQYSSLKKRLRVMYQNGSFGYAEVLLASKGITDFIRRVEYIGAIVDYDQNILSEYTETEKLIENQLEVIKTKKSQIETLSSQYNTKKANLERSIKAKEDLVRKLESEEESYAEQLDILERESKEIQRLIKAASVKATSKSSNKIYTSTGGSMEYPVPAYKGSTSNSNYGYRIHPIKKTKTMHAGIDLKATLGTDIVAARDGVVIFSGNNSGYGKTVIIDHGNGLSTLYAHNSSLVVGVGTSVKRGQVIAKAGSTGLSTGVHCHFEVRINGEHTNPAPYLGM